MSYYIEIKAYREIEKKYNKKSSVSSKDILNLGCGEGKETKELNEQLHTRIIGVDIDFNFIKVHNNNTFFCQSCAENLSFKDESFDAVYCYHVLEHVKDYKNAIAEIYRVLKNEGTLYLGVPNKHRFLGSLKTERVTLIDKFKNNITDWKLRILGEFENEKGAHAGYVEKFLYQDLKKYFSQVYCVRNEYYKIKYLRKGLMINSIIKLRLGEFLFPSNYFLCTK